MYLFFCTSKVTMDCFLSVFLIKMKINLPILNNHKQCTKAMLICCGEDATWGTTFEIGLLFDWVCSSSLSHSSSSVWPLLGANWLINGDIIGIIPNPPVSFRFFQDSTIIFAIPLGCEVVLYLPSWSVGKVGSFCLAFLTLIALIPQLRS